MSTHPPLSPPRRPAGLDGKEPRAWSWTVPPIAGECRHGLTDPAWCGICRRSPAPAATRPGVQDGR
jgi:hypothetical protein